MARKNLSGVACVTSLLLLGLTPLFGATQPKIFKVPPPNKPAATKPAPHKSSPARSTAKTPAKTALEKAPVLYLTFVMTVKGSGGSTEGETTTTWSVDRTYSGTTKLDKRTTALVPGTPSFKSGMTSDQMRAAVLKATKAAVKTVMWNSRFVKAGANSWFNVKAVIKDRQQRISTNPGGGELGEGSVMTTTTTWDCDTTLQSLNFAVVNWNTKNNTISAQFPLGGTDKKFQMTRTTTYKRVPPSSQLPNTSKTENMDAGSINAPAVDHWLRRWMAGQVKPLVINPRQDIAHFNSGTITPEHPLFGGEPDSKEKVKVVLRFKISSWL